MFDLFAIIAAIVFIVLVLQLRAMLAMPFPKQSARLAPGDWSKLLAAEDVIGAASAELSPLGFSGPHWLSVSPEPAEVANLRAIACFRRDADGVLVFLLPLFLPETPNRCISYLITRLQDGRSIVSQPSDPFFAITATAEEPAQLLSPAPFADLVAAHLAFVARQGVAAADATSDRVVADLAGRWINERRERLIARGLIAEAGDGIARPRLGFALRALRAFWSRPKWPPNSAPIPPARLTLIAQNSMRVRERAPTAAMQWLLFIVSNVLFMLVGAVVFGARFALILLVVIAIHEAGHYFAMRAFGYRNVQMLALPLVGGVTVGHEREPHATQRAWMSMMGPLPGILIGWVLLALSWPDNALGQGWLGQAAWVFLAVNYLNVVPVLPLDGGHIVQAMLPARWYSLRIGFLVLACVAGAVACYAFGLIGLAVIVLLQMLQVPVLLQNRRVIKHLLAAGGIPLEALRARKLRLTFDALDRVAGPSAHASARIAQAEDIVRSLEVVPMSWTSRVLTGGVYSALLVVPVLALVVGMAMFTSGIELPSTEQTTADAAAEAALTQRAQSMSEADLRAGIIALRVQDGGEAGEFDEADSPAAELREQWIGLQLGQRYEREHGERRDAAFAATAGATWPELIDAFERPPWWSRWIFAVPGWPAAATQADIRAAETRVGRDLPIELREFYAIHDGFALLQLGTAAEITAVAPPVAAMAEAAAEVLESPFALVDLDGDSGVRLRLVDSDLLGCFSLSAKPDPAYAEFFGWPPLLWCPKLEQAGAAIVSTLHQRAYRDFQLYVRERVAEQRALRP